MVGILWGGTNPFLKVATHKVKRKKGSNFVSELTDHLTNWNVSKYVMHEMYTINRHKCNCINK